MGSEMWIRDSVKIDAATGDVWLGEEKDLYSTEAYIEDLNWLDNVDDNDSFQIKVRFQHKGAEASIKKSGKGYRLKFKEPQRSVTPGQAAVIYKDSQLIGGGWIR